MSEQLQETSQSTQGISENTSHGIGASQGSSTGGAGQAQGVTTGGAENINSKEASYSPNYKYKFNDQELEFDEWVRPAVTKDSEEKIRELYQRAKYFEETKPKYTALRDEHGKLNDQWSTVLGNIKELDHYTDQGDFEAFFKKLNIPEEKIYKWVLDKVQYQGLPPEQRQVIDSKNEHARRLWELEQQNQLLQQQHESSRVQARTTELDMMLSSPQVKSVADALDQKLGRKGAFRDEVIRRGVSVSHTTGEDISTERAISETLAVYAPLVQIGQSGQAGAGSSNITGTPPVIPNIGGRNVSPTKKVIRSIDDIKKIAASME